MAAIPMTNVARTTQAITNTVLIIVIPISLFQCRNLEPGARSELVGSLIPKLLSRNLELFKYRIHLTHKPHALGFRCICHARAAHTIFRPHQQFNHHTVGFKIDRKIKGLAFLMVVLDIGKNI
jgi:hypothetical protein